MKFKFEYAVGLLVLVGIAVAISKGGHFFNTGNRTPYTYVPPSSSYGRR